MLPRCWYLESKLLGALYLELPVEKGESLIRKEDGEVLVWLGPLHLIFTPAWRLNGKCKQAEGVTTSLVEFVGVAVAFSSMLPLGDVARLLLALI